uniref:Bm8574 n=1 Tax=Brugia malayi TaxID=6279 RepID=A0A1I9G030_BRUMA|nr:Bm8574 [Brugia malayi]
MIPIKRSNQAVVFQNSQNCHLVSASKKSANRLTVHIFRLLTFPDGFMCQLQFSAFFKCLIPKLPHYTYTERNQYGFENLPVVVKGSYFLSGDFSIINSLFVTLRLDFVEFESSSTSSSITISPCIKIGENCDKVAVVDVWSDTTDSDILRKAFVHTVRVMLLHFIAGILTWGTPVIHLQLLLANTCLGIINDKVFIKRLDLSFALTVVCDFLALLALLVQSFVPIALLNALFVSPITTTPWCPWYSIFPYHTLRRQKISVFFHNGFEYQLKLACIIA